MSESMSRKSGGNIVWRQFLVGQTFGVAFAVVLYVIEPLGVWRDAHGVSGASLTAILAVYTTVGWVLGGAVGLVSGLLGGVFVGLRRTDGTVPGVGPLLGFLFMAMFIARTESARTLQSMPATVMISLAAALLVWFGMGYLGRRFLARYVPPARRPVLLKLLALIAFFALVVPPALSRVQSNGLPSRTADSASAPNIVLISVDALRPDHLSLYGYDRETSPNLDRFAENAIVFRNAYSHGNRTPIAMPSLFTSLYPSYHGVVAYQKMMIPMPEDRTTIAEICRDAGYTTVGVMSNVYLKSPFGLTRGFDVVEEFKWRHFELSLYRALAKIGALDKPEYPANAPFASVVTDLGIEWLRQIKDRPFFLFLHYMDVHHPYAPPRQYEQMFDSNGSDIDPMMLFMKTAALVGTPPPLRLSREELRRLIDLYDACIRYADEEIGRLLFELETQDLDRETVVIFTADHGDEFLENGTLYHNNLLIESLIRVPLIIGRVPDSGGEMPARSVGGMVRHVDVLPTIAELIGARKPAGTHGNSLVGLIKDGSEPSAEYSIAEGDFCTSLNAGRWKMVFVDSTDAYHLYNLAEDPLGLVDVSSRHPGQAAGLRAVLDEYLARVAELGQGEPRELPDDTVRQLKALGYLE